MTARSPQARRTRTIVLATLAFDLLLLVAYLGISTYAALTLTTPRRQPVAVTPATAGAAFEDVRFPSRGGDTQIAGWYLSQPDAGRALVLVHGKDSSRSAEFGKRFVELAADLRARGFAVLMIDLRGHGQSGDGRFTFGIEEREDLLGAVDYLGQQGIPPERVGVLGVSMGAATAIGAMASEPRLGALVADCSYAQIEPLMQLHWTESSRLPDFFLPSTLLVGQLVVGHDLTRANPVEEIDDLRGRPVLIIHGAADTFTPIEHGRELAAANPDADYWEVPGARHAGSYAVDPQAYTERVAEFFGQALP